MPRGFEICQYWDDEGTPWRLKVDADFARDSDRGWTIGTYPGLYELPRGWQPRAVMGIDESGRVQWAKIGRLDARLWTGAATRFLGTDNAGQLYIAEVIRHMGEVRR